MRDFKPDKLTIHVVSPERAVNYKWEKNSEKLSKNLELISIDDLESLPVDIRDKYFDVKHFEEGMVLILDSINQRYYPAKTSIQEIPRNKDMAIDHIAALLGARKIVRSVVTVDVQKREFSADGSIRICSFNSNGSYTSSEKTKAEKQYAGTKSYVGNWSERGYNEALEYCKKTGLIYEPGIRQMLEDRKPGHPNPKLSEDYIVTLTNGVEEATEAAFSLNYIPVFSLSANVKEVIETSRETTLKLRIEYGIM